MLFCVFLNGANNTMASYKDLLAQRDKLQAQIDEMRQQEREEAIALILGKMAEFEITTQELDKAGRKKRTRASK